MNEVDVHTLKLQYAEKLLRNQTAQISGLQAQVAALTTQVITQRDHITTLETWIGILESRGEDSRAQESVGQSRTSGSVEGRLLLKNGETVSTIC